MSGFFKKIFHLFQPPQQSQLKEQLRTISITGRVAYCVSCLENAFIIKRLHGPELDALFSSLWEFTSSLDLDEWQEKVMDFLPEGVIDDPPGEQIYLSQQQVDRLREIYLIIPPGLLTCISDTIRVGCSNLYFSTAGYSESTLTPAMRVVRYMIANNYPLPPIENFLRSPFTEQDMHGWGKRVDRSFFQ